MNLLGGLGPTIIGVMSAEVFLALIVVAARLYTRVILKPSVLGWDDHFIVISALLLAVYSFMCIAAAVHGFGRHASTLTTPQEAAANKLEVIGQTFLILGVATSKTSVSLFLMRIVVHRWQKAILWLLIVSLFIMAILCAIVDFAQCSPVEHVWNPTIPAHCWTTITPWSFAIGGASIIADFALAIMPWQILYSLNMPGKDKILIGISLSFGLFAGACGIVRTIALGGLNARSDYTFETVGLILWSSTELVITIVSASIPTLRPLWHHIMSGANSRYRSSDGVDEFSDPAKKRAPFLSHHLRNLERRNGPKKVVQDTLDSTMFTNTMFTAITVGDQKQDFEEESGIARNGSSMGNTILKTSDVRMEIESLPSYHSSNANGDEE